MNEYQALMEEPPDGHNHGRVTSSDPDQGRQGLETTEAQASEFLEVGGFSVVEVTRSSNGMGGVSAYGSKDAGMTNHLSSANGAAHIDQEQLKALVEEGLGFTLEQVAAAYAVGRPTPERLELRDAIDTRLLELATRGGNMTALARVFDWRIRDDGECRVMAGALRRARDAKAAA